MFRRARGELAAGQGKRPADQQRGDPEVHDHTAEPEHRTNSEQRQADGQQRQMFPERRTVHVSTQRFEKYIPYN